MICPICQKREGNFHAIKDNQVIKICETCSRVEGLPIIRKPTNEQLARANQRYTVRERMMKISGMDKLNPVSRDHEIAQRHLGKIRVPEKVQESSSLVENYNWNIKIARRRRKLTLSQLSEMTKIPVEVLDSIEKGVLVKNYEKIALQLEKILEIPILKEHEGTIRFIMPKKTDEEIVNDARNRINSPQTRDLKTEKSLEELELEELRKSVIHVNQQKKLEEKRQTLTELQKGELDFSDKRKLQNVTLDDLVKAKKERELKEKRMQEESKNMLGSDLELEG